MYYIVFLSITSYTNPYIIIIGHNLWANIPDTKPQKIPQAPSRGNAHVALFGHQTPTQLGRPGNSLSQGWETLKARTVPSMPGLATKMESPRHRHINLQQGQPPPLVAFKKILVGILRTEKPGSPSPINEIIRALITSHGIPFNNYREHFCRQALGSPTHQLLGILPTNYWVSYQPTYNIPFINFSPPLGNPCF